MVKQAKEQSAGCVGRGWTMARTVGSSITMRVSLAVSLVVSLGVSSGTELFGWLWYHWTARRELARQRRA